MDPPVDERIPELEMLADGFFFLFSRLKSSVLSCMPSERFRCRDHLVPPEEAGGSTSGKVSKTSLKILMISS